MSDKDTKEDIRIKARHKSFEILFSYEFNKEGAFSSIKELDTLEANIDCKTMVCDIFNGVIKNIDRIDELIKKITLKREFSRISKIVLTALRIAIFEILEKRAPIGVSVYEAVEITKIYSSQKEASCVNAMLAVVEKKLKK